MADGTIYLYFKSQDDLLISLFEDRMEQVNQNVRAALEGGGAPVDRLRRVLVQHLQLVEENPQLAEVLTVELRQSTKFLKEYKASKFGEFLKLIAQPIEEGQRDGSIRSDLEAPVVARALFGALDELVLAWVLGSQKRANVKAASKKPAGSKFAYELPHVAGQLADLFIEGLRLPRKAPLERHAEAPAATPTPTEIPASAATELKSR